MIEPEQRWSRQGPSVRSVHFWYNAPTIHSDALIRTLANRGQVKVTLVTARDMLGNRRQMGWVEPDYGAAHRVHRPDERIVHELIAAHAGEDSLHVFSGLHGFPAVYAAFRAVIRTEARVAIHAIRPDPRGWKGQLRRIVYAVQAARFRSRIDMFLALGGCGVDWYRGVGFPADRLHEFGNFVDGPAAGPLQLRPPQQPYTLLFAGELIPRKAVDVLLEALASLKASSWRLVVVGGGSEAPRLEALARRLEIAGRIEWLGFQPRDMIYATLRRSDLMVLPSTHDGWGAVANEALLSGVPVVTSDACGVANVVRSSGQGAVIPPGNVDALKRALLLEIERGPLSLDERERLRRWSGCILPDRGTDYFEALVDHVVRGTARPLPPWQR